jgi:hypothetical protein
MIPKITAVIPVWHTNPSELRQALTSLRTTQIASEIILVDDHGHDPLTAAELQAQSEQGCRVLISCGNQSISLARTTGVHAVKTPYVLSMDADDLLSITDDWRWEDLAPINLAQQNSPWTLPTELWSWLDSPGAVQWGSVLQTDLARTLTGKHPQREEDIYWGYKLYLTAWRDRLPIRTNSGISYHWRSPEGRQSWTARNPLNGQKESRLARWHPFPGEIMQTLNFVKEDCDVVEWWQNRKKLDTPRVVTLPHTGNPRIDVHVLSYLGNLDWLEQCLQSLTSEPCATHLVIGGFPGSIGAARAFAFTLGTAEYVCFMDDDDYVLPGIMQMCLEYLDQHPDCVGVYTDTEHLHENGHRSVEKKGRPWKPVRQLLYAPEVTHLKVMRRSAVMPYLNELAKWPTWEEYVICGLMAELGYWHHLPVVGAVKRVKPSSESSMRLATGELWKNAIRKVTKFLMQAKARL